MKTKETHLKKRGSSPDGFLSKHPLDGAPRKDDIIGMILPAKKIMHAPEIKRA